MKNFIATALVGLSLIAAGTVTASADTFAVHGYNGTSYGSP